MRLLLDTNILIFAAQDTLSQEMREIILSNKQSCFFSTASIWEMIIKEMSGKFALLKPPEQIVSQFIKNKYKKLDIKAQHMYQLRQLEPIHKDPFDRIMIAQAQAENMFFLTTDNLLASYGESVILVGK